MFSRTIKKSFYAPPKRRHAATRRPLIVNILIVVVAIVLAVFILYPLYSVFRESFNDSYGHYVGLDNYIRFVSSPYFRDVFIHTMGLCALVTVGAVIVGTIFAYTVVRTDVPGRRILSWFGVLPMITPTFIVAFAFILMFGRSGYISVPINNFLGTNWNIYGWPGIAFAEIVTYFPLTYLVITSALLNMDTSVEQAAHDLGARPLKVMLTITLPLITPALLTAALLVLMTSLAAFGAPALLGGNFTVLAVASVVQTLGVFNWGMGTTIAIFLMLPTSVLFFVQRRFRAKTSYVTVGGAPSHHEKRKTPPAIKWTLFAICTSISVLVTGIFLTVFIGSITKVWGIDASPTLDHYILAIQRTGSSIISTIKLSITGAFGAALFGLIVAYLVQRARYTGRGVIDFVATLPYAVPGTMMGLGFLVAFNKEPLILTGTGAIIIADFVIRRQPFGLRSGVSTLKQIDTSLEEASADLGARWIRTFSRIVLPLLKPAFFAGFTYALIHAMTELTSTIFLVSPDNRVMSVDIYNFVRAGSLGEAAALSCILIATILVTLAIVYRVTGIKLTELR